MFFASQLGAAWYNLRCDPNSDPKAVLVSRQAQASVRTDRIA
jgi:hypothetical protein